MHTDNSEQLIITLYTGCIFVNLTQVPVIWEEGCSPNKNPETEIGLQPEGLKSKAAKPLKKSYLYQGWLITN